jgi:hypothetical protein
MPLLLVFLLGILLSPLCSAANFSISLDAKKDPSIADPAYPGTGSTITSSFDKQSEITVEVAGRNYGNIPLPGNKRWGLKAGPLPLQNNKDAFVVTGGFQPSARGSRLTLLGADASYISITLNNVQPNTRFQNLSVELSGLSLVNTSNAWGAASEAGFVNWSPAASGFGNWASASLSNNGSKLTLTLPGFTWTSSGPVEIRLYGVTGIGDGSFTDLKISSTTSVVVPEPGTFLLLGAGLALTLTFRRRRRSITLPYRSLHSSSPSRRQ